MKSLIKRVFYKFFCMKMKIIRPKFTLLSIAFLLNLANLIGQNCVNTAHFSSTAGWNNCTTMTSSLGGTFVTTKTADQTGTRFFSFLGDGSPCSVFAPNGGTDLAMTIGSVQSLTCGSSKLYYINASNTTDNYVFKAGGSGISEGKAIIFRVQGAVSSVASVSRTPSGNVYGSQDITVNATMSTAFSTGQAVWIRYTQNNFTNSVITKLTGAGTSYTMTIPNAYTTVGSTLTYYLFTSGDVAGIAASDADLFTINYNNNGGSNYSTGTILPIELIDFKAVAKENTTILNWATASETNNQGFDIERSLNGADFVKIAFVKGAGTTNIIQRYTYTDATVQSTAYYRLKQVDTDGIFEYSKVVSVSTNRTNPLKIYPSPVSTTLNIQSESKSDFQILNLLGQEVLRGQTAQAVDVSALPQGNYILKVGTEQVKFVKQSSSF
jgi:Secretion system C-terminal sorting domain